MKIFKNSLFAFILGAVIFGSITAYATYKISSSDISFIPTNESWKVDNVGSAINDLYTNQNETIVNYEKTITSQNTKISNYESTINQKDSTISNLNSQITSLKNELSNNSTNKSLDNFTILDKTKIARTSAEIPSGVNKAYVLYSNPTNNKGLNLTISGDIVNEFSQIYYSTNTDNYGGDLRASIYIYEVDLTGAAGTLKFSVSGGAGTYRSWTVMVLY